VSAPSVAPHGAIALAKHAPHNGARVLDVCCGFGETALDLARLVGPRGSVVGFDRCDLSIAVARADALSARATNVSFVAADAASYPFPNGIETFDLLFSRFGATSFQAPQRALRNLRSALRAGGGALLVAWRHVEVNPWVAVPTEVIRRHLAQGVASGSERTRDRGPFAMADPDVARSTLTGAGYADVRLESIDVPIVVAKSVAEAIDFQLALGTAGEMVRAAGHLGDDRREALVADLRAALEPYVTPRGVVMGSSSWCITATRPP
jgi:SAM-dependent methyltransferase